MALLAVEVQRNRPFHSEMVLFDLATGKKRLYFPLENHGFHRGYVPILSMGRTAFRAGDKELAVARFTDTVCIWSLETGEKIRELKRPDRKAAALAISCDGRVLASAITAWFSQGSRVPNGSSRPRELGRATPSSCGT